MAETDPKPAERDPRGVHRLIPFQLAQRPSQREALAEANKEYPRAQRMRALALVVLSVVVLVLLLVVAVRDCG